MPERFLVKITRRAEKDLEKIYDYINADNPEAARKFVSEIEKQIRTLETMPNRCPVISEGEEGLSQYRHLLYGDYRTIFRVRGRTVLICRIIHGARLLDLSSLK